MAGLKVNCLKFPKVSPITLCEHYLTVIQRALILVAMIVVAYAADDLTVAETKKKTRYDSNYGYGGRITRIH